MALTDTKVRQAKQKDKPYKLSDGNNLFLHIHPNGSKYWRYRYQWCGREKILALGVYPLVTLAEARQKRDVARRLKAQLIDPAEDKRQQKLKVIAADKNTFEAVAREWHKRKGSEKSPYYAKQILQRLEKDVFPAIGKRPISMIKRIDIVNMAQAIQERGAIEMAYRAIQICRQIFNYALIHEWVNGNPAMELGDALKSRVSKHNPYLTRKELPQFLETLEKYDGGFQTKLAIRFILLTFVRTNEVCNARWDEIDFDAKQWVIPAERMKMRSTHIVPLSNEALAILEILKKLNGKWEHVFASTQSKRKTMSNNTMLVALHAMGYKGKTTIHGFRATASTILNESGKFNRDIIERQLAHQERSKVRGAYNHADYMPERIEMMQWWANELHQIRPILL